MKEGLTAPRLGFEGSPNYDDLSDNLSSPYSLPWLSLAVLVALKVEKTEFGLN